MNFTQLYDQYFGAPNYDELLIRLVISLLIFVVAKIISVFVAKASKFFTVKIFKAKTENGQLALHNCIVKPFAALIWVTGLFLAIKSLPFTAAVKAIYSVWLIKGYRIALIYVACRVFVNLIGNFHMLSKKIATNADKTAYTFFSKLAKGVVIVFAVAAFLTELNFDISGIIAGLGISGVVLALAAQDTASNFFSGVVILFDRPFAIGDWISVGGMEGVVEEMNFRSCRIRTFDNALISVPNSKLSNDSVTNWAKMNVRKTRITIGLVYSTKKETLQKVCAEIKENLKQYDVIKKENIMVWFDNFNASSLDIVIQYHTYLTAGADYLALKEEIQYMIMDVIERNGTDFAFNTQTIVIENQ